MIVAVLLIGPWATWWMVHKADQQNRESLLRQTELLGQAISLDELRSLSGTEADLGSPVYLRVKKQLHVVRQAYKNCRFLYLMGRNREGAVFFFADSEPAESEQCSPAGQIYNEASKVLHGVFETETGNVEGPVGDRWGSWVSAFVPLSDPATGKLIAVLGMDVNTSAWGHEVTHAALPGIFLTCTLLLILVTGVFLMRKRARCGREKAAWMRGIEPALVGATGMAVTGCLSWMVHQAELRNSMLSFLNLANSRSSALIKSLCDFRDVALESLGNNLVTHADFSWEQFQEHTSYLTRIPIVRSWQWLPAVPAAEKDEFERRARASGLSGFQIWEKDKNGKRVPASGREVYYPIYRVAPVADSEAILGFDPSSDEIRRASIEAAARTGLPSGSDPVHLIQDPDKEKAMLVYRPVFGAETAGRSLRGFAVAILRFGVTLKGALPDEAALVEFELLHEDGSRELLASSAPLAGASHGRMSAKRPMLMFGKVFVLTTHSGPQFGRIHPMRGGGLVAGMGFLVTGAFTISVGAIFRKHEELEQLVAERTAELRDSQRKTERHLGLIDSLFDSIPDMIAFKDTKGFYLGCNPAFAEFLGKTKEEIVGKTAHELFEGNLADGVERQDRETLVRGQKTLQERWITYPDGRKVLVETIRALYLGPDGSLIGLLGISRDITERKRAEDELRIAKEAAEVANRAKSDFLANMSHEIRTPLNAIIGFTQLMQREGSLSREQSQRLEIINRSGKALLSLISDILEMSKIEAGRVSLAEVEFDLHGLLEDQHRIFWVEAEAKNLFLRMEGVERMPRWVRGDEKKLRQILFNLLGNAVKFTNSGGITLRLSLVGESSVGMDVAFEVEDTGPGISEEEQSFLFRRFSQTQVGRSTGGGTGLGLAITREFVRIMGGEIDVQSTVGRGTVFRFHIRLRRAQGGAKAHGSSSASLSVCSEGSSCRVLIVDDKDANRLLIRDMLVPAGFEFREAADGAAAVELFQSWKPDLILMDLRMPGMDGCEAIRRVRSLPGGESVKLVANSASAFDKDRETALVAGADLFLHKPIEYESLSGAILQLLQEKVAFAEKAVECPPEMASGGVGISVPAEWIAEMRHSVQAADFEQVERLVERIAEAHPGLAAQLSAMAERFSGPEILKLLDAMVRGE